MTELRANTFAWLTLLALTLVGYGVSDRLGGAALVPILGLAVTKSSIVGFRFMGLGRAHPAARAAFLLLAFGIILALFVAHRLG